MKPTALLLFLACCQFSFSQYTFTGVLPLEHAHQMVSLSLVEDYRQTERVYANQIIQKTKADALGNFIFNGDHLSNQNRIYRIHFDTCSNLDTDKTHFLGACNTGQQVLFIANNNDHVIFPILTNDQALCAITATNEVSPILLEIDGLKEEMILDFMDSPSAMDRQLKFKKWFSTLHEYALRTKEPLTELYIHGFLTDRTNETYAYYLKDVETNSYYGQLASRLEHTYPDASFTRQYQNELKADRVYGTANDRNPKTRFWPYLFWGGILFLLIQVAYFKFKRKRYRKKRNPFDSLTAQERTIMAKISEGKTNKEIAAELFISLSTVKTHINNLYRKLEVSSRDDIKALF